MPKTGHNSGHSTFVHCMFRSTNVTCPLIDMVIEIKQLQHNFGLPVT